MSVIGPTKPSARRPLCSFVRLAYIKHQYMGDTIHLCLGVSCQPRQWTRNRHAPRQVRDDSLSCLNGGGIQEHNRVDARCCPVPWVFMIFDRCRNKGAEGYPIQFKPHGILESLHTWMIKKGTNKNSKLDIGTKYNRSVHSAVPDG